MATRNFSKYIFKLYPFVFGRERGVGSRCIRLLFNCEIFKCYMSNLLLMGCRVDGKSFLFFPNGFSIGLALRTHKKCSSLLNYFQHTSVCMNQKKKKKCDVMSLDYFGNWHTFVFRVHQFILSLEHASFMQNHRLSFLGRMLFRVPSIFVIHHVFFLFHCFSIQLWHFNDIQTIRCDATLVFVHFSVKKTFFVQTFTTLA